MGRILVVCTGNICRSPMAEAFLRHELEQRGLVGISVESSGVSGWEDSPATDETATVAAEYGLDVSSHRARRLARRMVESADLVIGLSAEHRDSVIELLPDAEGRTFTLKELVRLLEALPARSEGADLDEQLRRRVHAAADLRASGRSAPLGDEDVADPLGLGVDGYRAVAWEIDDFSRRVVEGLFAGGGVMPARSGPAHREARTDDASTLEGEAR